MSKIRLFLSAIAFSMATLCADEAPKIPLKMDPLVGGLAVDQPVSDGTHFTSTEGGYSFEHPEGWEVKQNYMGMDVVILSPPDSSDDTFRENMNVLYGELQGEIGKEDYYHENIRLLEKLLTDFKLLEQGTVNIDGVEAKWVKYNHRMGDVDATVLQYLVLKGNKAYVFTFVAKPEDYEKYKETFQKIVNSIKFS